MKKLLIHLALIILGTLIAGVYGMLHDQVSYTVSPEYFTKFKYIQFGMDHLEGRMGASLIGLLATWWVGFYGAIILGLVGWRFPSAKIMFIETLKSIGLALFLALVIGLLGLLVGFLISPSMVQRNESLGLVPEEVVEVRHFLVVGVMHNFSYLGGLIGLLIGSIRLWRKSKKMKVL
jgi:hypothetical protein